MDMRVMNQVVIDQDQESNSLRWISLLINPVNTFSIAWYSQGSDLNSGETLAWSECTSTKVISMWSRMLWSQSINSESNQYKNWIGCLSPASISNHHAAVLEVALRFWTQCRRYLVLPVPYGATISTNLYWFAISSFSKTVHCWCDRCVDIAIVRDGKALNKFQDYK